MSIEDLFNAAKGGNNNAGFLPAGTHSVLATMVNENESAKHPLRVEDASGASAVISYRSNLIAALRVGLGQRGKLAAEAEAVAFFQNLEIGAKLTITINPVKGKDGVTRDYIQSIKPRK